MIEVQIPRLAESQGTLSEEHVAAHGRAAQRYNQFCVHYQEYHRTDARPVARSRDDAYTPRNRLVPTVAPAWATATVG
jgi:nicotinamidase-related amidase